MKRVFLVAVCATVSLWSAAAQASEEVDRLSQCLVESASPKDQATLVRWIFSAVGQNPSLKSMSTLTAEEREQINRNMAAMFERLMLQDCRKDAVAAMKAEGPKAVELAFGVMGQRAAQQLMSDPASTAELEKMASYLDEAKWAALMKDGKPDQPKSK